MQHLAQLLHDHHGVLTTAALPHHTRRFSRWCAAGLLTRVLKGVYVAAARASDPATLIRAVATTHPDAIFTGRAAAWLNGWSDLVPARITAIHPGRSLTRGRIRLIHGELADDLWQEGALPGGPVRAMTLAMAAIDLVDELGGKVIDRFMRTARQTTRALDQLRRALAASPGRRGNRRRRVILDRTGTNPWSGGERELHDLLDSAGITGWEANIPLDLDDGHGGYVIPDVLFKEHALIIEFDSWRHHGDRESFENDRHRNNRLLLAGWRILHVTARMLTDPDRLAAMIRTALAGPPARTRGRIHRFGPPASRARGLSAKQAPATAG